uniref:Uncharacterized protein n=1 Tax=Zeugodacus cucurbitae TaxID=28588 RepID=A0A0A1XBE1_ZEUCU
MSFFNSANDIPYEMYRSENSLRCLRKVKRLPLTYMHGIQIDQFAIRWDLQFNYLQSNNVVGARLYINIVVVAFSLALFFSFAPPFTCFLFCSTVSSPVQSIVQLSCVS